MTASFRHGRVRRLEHLHHAMAAAALLVVLGAGAAPAEAASGRFCGDPVESGYSTGATQEEALKAAQSWWSSRAGTRGRGYEHWEHADERSMECKKNDQGAFKCKATGRPCLPPGTLPENVPKIEM